MEPPYLTLHKEAEPPEEYSLDTPEGRAARALLAKELTIDELCQRLAQQITTFIQMEGLPTPAVIMERQRVLCRIVFEELMTRGPGRSRPRD